jgi:formate hydrogenlyase subunit 3/multisubunit Na+/H+ antiporter MnhD subunit
MNNLPPLPVALPLAVAALFMATASVLSRRLRDLLAIATALGVAVICGLLAYPNSCVYTSGIIATSSRPKKETPRCGDARNSLLTHRGSRPS